GPAGGRGPRSWPCIPPAVPGSSCRTGLRRSGRRLAFQTSAFSFPWSVVHVDDAQHAPAVADLQHVLAANGECEALAIDREGERQLLPALAVRRNLDDVELRGLLFVDADLSGAIERVAVIGIGHAPRLAWLQCRINSPGSPRSRASAATA